MFAAFRTRTHHALRTFLFYASIAKISTLALLLILAVSQLAPPAFSQTTNTPTSQDEFEKQIGITPEQKDKMAAVRQKYQQKIDQLTKERSAKIATAKGKKQSSSIQRQFDQKMKVLAGAANAEMQAILTPQQRLQIRQIEAGAKQQQVHVKGCPLTDADIVYSLKKSTLCWRDSLGINGSPITDAKVVEHGTYNAEGKYWPFKVKFSSEYVNKTLECEMRKDDYGTYKIQISNSSNEFLR